MYTYVYMYVCVEICDWYVIICMRYIYSHTNTHAHTYTHMQSAQTDRDWIDAFILAASALSHTPSASRFQFWTCMRAYIFVHVYVTVCFYHMYVCIYMCVHVCACTCACACVWDDSASVNNRDTNYSVESYGRRIQRLKCSIVWYPSFLKKSFWKCVALEN